MSIIRRKQSGKDIGWQGLDPKAYGASGISKHILIGPDDGARNFAMRVFEVPVGQASMNEHHPHDHGVVVLSGRGRVLLGTERHEIGPGDAVWVSPDEQHQFESLGPDPLRFICVVPSWGEVDAKDGCLVPQPKA